jgi:hypothetical protein
MSEKKESVAALRKQLRESLPKVGKMPRDEVVAHLVKLGKRGADPVAASAAPVVAEKKAEPVAEKPKVEKKKAEKSAAPMKKEVPAATEKKPSSRPAKGSQEAKERMAAIRMKRKSSPSTKD